MNPPNIDIDSVMWVMTINDYATRFLVGIPGFYAKYVYLEAQYGLIHY